MVSRCVSLLLSLGFAKGFQLPIAVPLSVRLTSSSIKRVSTSTRTHSPDSSTATPVSMPDGEKEDLFDWNRQVGDV